MRKNITILRVENGSRDWLDLESHCLYPVTGNILKFLKL